MHLGNRVDAVDGRRRRAMRSAMCSTARSSEMLMFSPGNIASGAARAPPRRQVDQQGQGFPGDAVLAEIEVEIPTVRVNSVPRAGSSAKNSRRSSPRSRRSVVQVLPGGSGDDIGICCARRSSARRASAHPRYTFMTSAANGQRCQSGVRIPRSCCRQYRPAMDRWRWPERVLDVRGARPVQRRGADHRRRRHPRRRDRRAGRRRAVQAEWAATPSRERGEILRAVFEKITARAEDVAA